SASRFFYCAKAGPDERRDSKHPTVKPVALMRYLVRLVTPIGATVLDPFCGSGTTLEAAMLESCKAIGIELNPEYCADAVERLRQGVLF
ncbi:MAG: DNA methyltransferase, partial [Fluviibacter sp.]